MAVPEHCRPSAYDEFLRRLGGIDSTEGLVAAAAAIAMHEREEVDPEAVLEEVRIYARRVRDRIQGASVQSILAHLHAVLFDEERFRGNAEQYYDAGNSYLPVVLERKVGIPVSLTLIYKAVGEQLGLQIEGVGASGHFLARVQTDNGPMLVDPFFGGQVLTRDEAVARIESIIGAPVEPDADPLPAASHTAWLERMLGNLLSIFAQAERKQDMAAMLELRALL